VFENPYVITVYSAGSFAGDAGHWAADVWAFEKLQITLRHNATSTAAITVAMSDPAAGALIEPGARIKIWKSGQLLMTGVLDLVSGQGPSFSGSVTATFNSDFAILHHLVTFPQLAGGSLTDGNLYWKMNGAAETVAKTLISENVADRGLSYVSIVSSSGRGSTIDVKTRFEELYNALYPQVDNADIGLTAVHDGTHIVIDAYAVTDFPEILDEASGVVDNWSFSSAAPTANLVWAGASYNPSGSPGVFEVESAQDATSRGVWGTRESYKAAQGGSGTTEADVIAACHAEADAGVLALGERNGISIKLTDSGMFKYGVDSGLLVGKRVTVALAGVTRTDILREVQFDFSPSTGDQTTPVVGDISGDPDHNLAAYIASLRKGIKRLEARISN
jgi:hypothetical protein